MAEPGVRPEILRIITRLNIGGPARQALLLTRELAVDFPTTLVAGTPPAHEGELTDPEVTVQRAPLRRPIAPVEDLRGLAHLRGRIRARNFALVHTHMAKAGTLGRLAALTSGRRIRTVHTFHGHVLEGYFRPSVERVFVSVERALAERTDVLVAISPQIRDALLDLGIGTPGKIEVIPLGFDLSRFLEIETSTGDLRKELGIGARDPIIGAVGRLAAIKDIPTLLRAVASLQGVHLVLVGDGEERAALTTLARTLGVSDRVHFLGWRLDVASVMADLDLVVLSSRNEGTPVSLIEAQACAKAVVATNVGGVPFVIDDGTSGLLCPPGRPDELARAVTSLLASPEKALEMGRSGREWVRSRFSKERLVSDIKSLYEGLIKSSHLGAKD